MKNKVLSYSFSVALLIVALAIAYYFAVVLPKIQDAKQELEEQKFEFQKTESMKEELNQQYYSSCASESAKSAEELLKEKIEIAATSGADIPLAWKEASNKGMYLKDDYDSYYKQCLQTHGLK
jgi:uncharacterized protein HemX